MLPHCSLLLYPPLMDWFNLLFPLCPPPLPILAGFSAGLPPHGAFSCLLAAAQAVFTPQKVLDLSLQRPQRPCSLSVLTTYVDFRYNIPFWFISAQLRAY